MCDHKRRLVPGLAALLVLLLAPAPGAGQEQPLAFELRGGVGLPAFDLADRADPGFAFGLDLAHRLTPRVSLVAGGDVELLAGAGGDGAVDHPDVNVWHYGVGVEAQLLDPARTWWRLSASAGAGGTTFDVASGGASSTEPAVYAGLELGWDASEEMDVFVGVRSWVAFAGESTLGPDPRDTAPVGDAAGGDGDTLWSFPLTAGVRLTF